MEVSKTNMQNKWKKMTPCLCAGIGNNPNTNFRKEKLIYNETEK